MDLKEGQIVLFKNKNKNKPQHPDGRGFMLLNGIEYEISLWNGESKKGHAYSSGNVSLPYKPDLSNIPNDDFPDRRSAAPADKKKSGDLPW